MPKPNTKGGKNFKKGKKKPDSTIKNNEPEAVENYHRYAQVEKKLGGNVLDLMCSDGIKRHGIIRGKMIKRIWMNPSDILLVELNNELNTSAKTPECFITHKYSNHKANNLKSQGVINFNVKADDDSDINFGEDNGQSGYDNIYAEMDKIDGENKDDDDSNTKDTKDVKEAKKRALREKDKLDAQSRQLARKKKDDEFDFDSI
jgi:initiation factor 1A